MDIMFLPLIGIAAFVLGLGIGWLLGRTQLPGGPGTKGGGGPGDPGPR